MSWKVEKFSSLLTESKIPCETPNSDKRIRVRLNVKGVEKRPDTIDKKGATKQYIRKAGQFIYGKQNFHKGAFGIIPPELDSYETSADIPSFDVREDCLPEWIYYFFKAGNRYLELTKYARGVGSKRIHPKQVADIEIPLPPIETQRRIIEELKIIEKDEISTHLTHQLDLVKKLRQSFLREAMQGKLVEQNPNDEPATELLAKIKAEKEQLIKDKKIKKQKSLPPITKEEIPFEIPENWVWCRLGEITNYGSSQKADPNKFNNDTWVLDLEDIEKETSRLLNKVRFNERNSLSTKSVFEFGDVLYSKLRPYLDKVIVADENGVCTTEILPLKCFSNTNPYFFRYALKRPDFISFVNSVTKGMKMPRLGTEEGRKALIPLPPLAEQKRIVAKLDELMAYCDSLEESIKNSQIQNEMLLGQVLREALEPKPEKDVTV